MPDKRVLVVGTTPDYIDYINRNYPGRATFITDSAVWVGSGFNKPERASEIICRLSETDTVIELLHEHLKKYKQEPVGVACYDCEWLALASKIADHLRLPFPDIDSVKLCRNKHLSKARWIRSGVPCPRTELIQHGWQAVAFLNRIGKPIVLKPLSGSGSELTFVCHDQFEAANAAGIIKTGLKQRASLPLYSGDGQFDAAIATDGTILAEEYIEGREYSCDFIIDGDDVRVIRVAKKIRRPGPPFGTTLAYIVPARLPAHLSEVTLRDNLKRAASGLGLTRAICMVDFIINHDGMFILELTPRIGGDCLPPLIRHSCGLDMIGLALDFARGRPLELPPVADWRTMAGMRFFSPSNGIYRGCDTGFLTRDSRVREVYLKRSPGHRVVLPPEDYDSWLLGHVIFQPEEGLNVAGQCEDLLARIVIELEPNYDKKLAGIHHAGGGVAQAADSAAG